MSFGAIVTAILSAIPAIEKILGTLAKYFPPSSPAEKGVQKYKKAVETLKKENLKLRETIRKAKTGRTNELEKILRDR